jgi:bla regulator protein BlaR1
MRMLRKVGSWSLPIILANALLVTGASLGIGILAVRAQERAVKFEVVSIHRGDSGPMRMVTWGPTPNGYHISNAPLVSVILEAYLEVPKMNFRLPDDRVKGAPAWVMDDSYVIEAQADEATIAAMKGKARWEQINMEAPLLRAMLQDRFKLSAHTVSADVPGYALVVSKRGIKMKEVQPGEPLPAGGMSVGGSWKMYPLWTPDRKVSGTRYAQITMSELATLLSNQGSKPVIDQTGLTGRYDFDLLTAVDSADENGDAASNPKADVAHKYDWSALGLEMKPMKSPVMTVVVDHIERPSEN